MERYVKIRSWHIVSLISRAGWYITYCGRVVQTPRALASELPDEKSCESCLRISERRTPE